MRGGVIALAWLLLSQGAEAAVPSVKHVIHLVFENADVEEVLQVPFFGKLAKEGAFLSRFSAVTHPSQPNYIAMIAGDPLGVLLDGEVNLTASHLGDLFEKRGLSWKAYAEDYPGNCFLGMKRGKYVRKHLPFLSFTNVQKHPERCARVQGGERFFLDFKEKQLPEYSMFVPNLDHDGHDTSVSVSGQWFSDHFGELLQASQNSPDFLWIITFDESESYFGQNRVYTVLYGAGVVPGTRVTSALNHYSILRLIEDLFDLDSLGRQDRSAQRVPQIWKTEARE